MATVDRAPTISRMGEIGRPDCWSEATAEKRCLGLRIGIRGRLCGWESPVRGRGTGGSNGISLIESYRKWFEPRCLGQPFCLTVVGLH